MRTFLIAFAAIAAVGVAVQLHTAPVAVKAEAKRLLTGVGPLDQMGLLMAYMYETREK